MQYVPQRPSLLPSTPLDFLTTVRSYRSRSKSAQNEKGGPNTLGSNTTSLDPLALAEEWGIDKTMWRREWNTLSGGEGQRMALAIAVGLGGAEVVLLDGEYYPSIRACTRPRLIWPLPTRPDRELRVNL